MTRKMVLAIPFAVCCTLVVFESKRGLGASKKRESALPSGIAPHYNTQELQASTEYQAFDHNHSRTISYSDWHHAATSRAPIHEIKSKTKKVSSCFADGRITKSFLMIFMGHSGSSAIISELQSHSRILIEAPEPIDHHEYEFNTSLSLKYTREFFLRGAREGNVVGFKMRPWHIGQQPEAWAALAREFDTRIIWQYRKNILKQAVGEYSKKYFDDNSSVEGLRSEEEIKNRCKRGSGCRFKISDFNFFHRTLKDCLHSDLAIARGVNLILNGSKCVHDLPYEDYLYDGEKTMKRLQQFLGVEYERTMPNRFKATSDSLCDVIENWDEVCEKFYGCHVWRHMFDDTRNGCSCHFSSGSTKYCDTVFEN